MSHLINSKISGFCLSRCFMISFMAVIILLALSSAPCLQLFSAAPEILLWGKQEKVKSTVNGWARAQWTPSQTHFHQKGLCPSPFPSPRTRGVHSTQSKQVNWIQKNRFDSFSIAEYDINALVSCIFIAPDRVFGSFWTASRSSCFQHSNTRDYFAGNSAYSCRPYYNGYKPQWVTLQMFSHKCTQPKVNPGWDPICKAPLCIWAYKTQLFLSSGKNINSVYMQSMRVKEFSVECETRQDKWKKCPRLRCVKIFQFQQHRNLSLFLDFISFSLLPFPRHIIFPTNTDLNFQPSPSIFSFLRKFSSPFFYHFTGDKTLLENFFQRRHPMSASDKGNSGYVRRFLEN